MLFKKMKYPRQMITGLSFSNPDWSGKNPEIEQPGLPMQHGDIGFSPAIFTQFVPDNFKWLIL
jgi:hypothetical protein